LLADGEGGGLPFKQSLRELGEAEGLLQERRVERKRRRFLKRKGAL